MPTVGPDKRLSSNMMCKNLPSALEKIESRNWKTGVSKGSDGRLKSPSGAYKEPQRGSVLPGPAEPQRHSAAMNPDDDATSGFRHAKVLMFIKEQMAKHARGPEFYLENMSLSWEEVEDKLRVILDSSEVPREAQEACAWSSLALGVRFALRQSQLQGRRVQWLHDFASLHRSAAQVLASNLKKLTDQQEMERKEVAFQLHLAHNKLAELQRERDLMRLKLLHAVRLPPNSVLAPPLHPYPIPPLHLFPIPGMCFNSAHFSPGAEGCSSYTDANYD